MESAISFDFLYMNYNKDTIVVRDEKKVAVRKTAGTDRRIVYFNRDLPLGSKLILRSEQAMPNACAFSYAFGVTTCDMNNVYNNPCHALTPCQPEGACGGQVIIHLVQNCDKAGNMAIFERIHNGFLRVNVLTGGSRYFPVHDGDGIFTGRRVYPFLMLTGSVDAVRILSDVSQPAHHAHQPQPQPYRQIAPAPYVAPAAHFVPGPPGPRQQFPARQFWMPRGPGGKPSNRFPVQQQNMRPQQQLPRMMQQMSIGSGPRQRYPAQAPPARQPLATPAPAPVPEASRSRATSRTRKPAAVPVSATATTAVPKAADPWIENAFMTFKKKTLSRKGSANDRNYMFSRACLEMEKPLFFKVKELDPTFDFGTISFGATKNNPADINFQMLPVRPKELLFGAFMLSYSVKVNCVPTLAVGDSFSLKRTINGVVVMTSVDSNETLLFELDPTLNFYPFFVFNGIIKSLEVKKGLGIAEKKKEPPAQGDESEKKLGTECVVCICELPCHLCQPCGHLVYCDNCYESVKIHGDITKCPKCRVDVTFQRVYL